MPTDAIIHILCVSLVLLVPFSLRGTQPSWWAVAGAVMYPVSYVITSSFHLAFYALDPLPAEYATALSAAMEGAPPNGYGFALRIYTASKLLLVSVYSFMVFFALSKYDSQARLIWLLLAIAETFELLEYAQCKMLIDPFGSNDLHLTQVWGIEVSTFACGRLFVGWAPYLPPVITAAYFLWINRKFRQV